MSESIIPWIAPYLVGVAEKHGADIAAIPKFEKQKKVQIIEFLSAHREDDVLWARISDKEYNIPVRFSKDAVQTYSKFHTTSVTKHKTSIVYIKHFKPIFTRIPIGKDRLTTEKHLAIECDAFSAFGSFGEPRFGNPKQLVNHPDLLEWSNGLKQDGGAGNCLKNRKQEQLQAAVTDPLPPPPSPPPPAQPPLQPATNTTRSSTVAVTQEPSISEVRKRRLQVVFVVPDQPDSRMKWISGRMLRPPPSNVAGVLAALKAPKPSTASPPPPEPKTTPKRPRVTALLSSPPESPESTPTRSRSGTPLSEQEWPPSEAPDEQMFDIDSDDDLPKESPAEVREDSPQASQPLGQETSYFVPATPSQRQEVTNSQSPPWPPSEVPDEQMHDIDPDDNYPEVKEELPKTSQPVEQGASYFAPPEPAQRGFMPPQLPPPSEALDEQMHDVDFVDDPSENSPMEVKEESPQTSPLVDQGTSYIAPPTPGQRQEVTTSKSPPWPPSYVPDEHMRDDDPVDDPPKDSPAQVKEEPPKTSQPVDQEPFYFAPATPARQREIMSSQLPSPSEVLDEQMLDVDSVNGPPEDSPVKVNEKSPQTSQLLEQGTSYIVPPTPAQRHRITTSQLPPSSPPPLDIEVSVIEETFLEPYPTPTSPSKRLFPTRTLASRKVPRPRPIITRLAEEPVILAPNSDTSYSQSQTQSQSQSQSLSQPFVQSTQDVVLSQLPTLARSPARPEAVELEKIDDNKERELSCEPHDTDNDAGDVSDYEPDSLFSFDESFNHDDGDNDNTTTTQASTPSRASPDLLPSERFASPAQKTHADSEGLLPPPKSSLNDETECEDPKVADGPGGHGSTAGSQAPDGNFAGKSDGKQIQDQGDIAHTTDPQASKIVGTDTEGSGPRVSRGATPITPARAGDGQATDLANDERQNHTDAPAPAIPDDQPLSSRKPPRNGKIVPVTETTTPASSRTAKFSRQGTREPAPHVVREVQHDAQAWKEPSFMKAHASSADVKTPIGAAKKPNGHVSEKIASPSRPVAQVINVVDSNSAGSALTEQEVRQKPRKGAILRSRPSSSRSNEKLDPAAHASISSHQMNSSKTASSVGSTTQPGGTFGKKRGQSLALDSSASENQNPLPRKRRRITTSKKAVETSQDPANSDDDPPLKLGGFTIRMNPGPSDCTLENGAGCLSWEALRDIWKRNLAQESD